MTETDAARLKRLGVSDEEFEALERLWGTQTLTFMMDERSFALWDWGYSALDTMDAIRHELAHHDAHLYMQHGFTPHQAWLLDTASRARRNLWDDTFETAQVHDFLTTDLSPELLTQILLVSYSFSEAREFVTTIGYTTPPPKGTPIDPNHDIVQASTDAQAVVESRAASDLAPVDVCDCTW
jgi:hypothetical protein